MADGFDLTRAARISVAAAAVMIAAATISGCGSAPRATVPTETGFIEIGLEVVPDAKQFFNSEEHARISGDDGVVSEWKIIAGGPSAAVPAGTFRLEAFSVFFSDWLQCSPDPARPGQEICFAPTLGPAQVCAIPVTIRPDETSRATFRVLPDGRCELLEAAGPT